MKGDVWRVISMWAVSDGVGRAPDPRRSKPGRVGRRVEGGEFPAT
jgi:hypothetical protein